MIPANLEFQDIFVIEVRITSKKITKFLMDYCDLLCAKNFKDKCVTSIFINFISNYAEIVIKIPLIKKRNKQCYTF